MWVFARKRPLGEMFGRGRPAQPHGRCMRQGKGGLISSVRSFGPRERRWLSLCDPIAHLSVVLASREVWTARSRVPTRDDGFTGCETKFRHDLLHASILSASDVVPDSLSAHTADHDGEALLLT